jgi:hypothetical protein
MAQQFNFNVSVSTNAGVSGETVAKVLQKLIDAGLADAQKTLEDGVGDITSAELATDMNIGAPFVIPREEIVTQETSVPVKNWESYDVEGTPNTHVLDIDDQRIANGQAFITVGASEGNVDDILSVAVEVNTNPLSGIEDVPCVHVHFDGDSTAVVLYKIGNRILVRPEEGVSVTPYHQEINGSLENFLWVD